LPAASEPILAVDVAGNPSDIAVGGQGNVWSANEGENSLTRIIPSSNTIDQEIALPGAPGDIAIASGPVWVAIPELGAVTKVEFATNEASAPIEVTTPGADMELTVGTDVLWIVSKGDAVYRLDGGSSAAVQVELTDRPIDIAVHDSLGYVLDEDGTVTEFVQATGLPTGNAFTVPGSADGDLIFAAGGLWHFGGIEGSLTKHDPETGAQLAGYQVNGRILDLAIDPKVAWVLEIEESSRYRLVRIDRQDASATGDVVVLEGEAVEAGISGGRLWVTDRSGGRVLAFDKLP
jgi:streptogramin lyase